MLGYVGIEAVLDQLKIKAMKMGFEFNIMVVGKGGAGGSQEDRPVDATLWPGCVTSRSLSLPICSMGLGVVPHRSDVAENLGNMKEGPGQLSRSEPDLHP